MFNPQQILKAIQLAIRPENLQVIECTPPLFFFVAPLVSTIFASCGRMLSNLDAESLGWVLIDEAEQACPQQAAGGGLAVPANRRRRRSALAAACGGDPEEGSTEYGGLLQCERPAEGPPPL